MHPTRNSSQRAEGGKRVFLVFTSSSSFFSYFLRSVDSSSLSAEVCSCHSNRRNSWFEIQNSVLFLVVKYLLVCAATQVSKQPANSVTSWCFCHSPITSQQSFTFFGATRPVSSSKSILAVPNINLTYLQVNSNLEKMSFVYQPLSQQILSHNVILNFDKSSIQLPNLLKRPN